METELEKVNARLDEFTEGYFESYDGALSQILTALELSGLKLPSNFTYVDDEVVYEIQKEGLPKKLFVYMNIERSDDYQGAFEAYAQVVDEAELEELLADGEDDPRAEAPEVSMPTKTISTFLRQARRSADD